MKAKTAANNGRNLHGSITVAKQTRTFRRTYFENGWRYRVEATVSWASDDIASPGVNRLTATGKLWRKAANGRWVCELDDLSIPGIVNKLPKLAAVLKWYMGSAEAPIGYFDAVYMAGNRDFYGRAPGTVIDADYYVGFSHGGSILESVLCTFRNGYPYPTVFKTKALASRVANRCGGIVSEHKIVVAEGKPRDLDSARRLAHLSDASDWVLMRSPEALRRRLEKRLPAVMAEFRKDIEALGLRW